MCSKILLEWIPYLKYLAASFSLLSNNDCKRNIAPVGAITLCLWRTIAAIQAIYVPADDLTDPAPATTFAHLDATTVLSRGIAELGIYPAVDPLDSTSRIMDPNIIGGDHYEVARGVQKILQVSRVLDVSLDDIHTYIHTSYEWHIYDT